MSIAEMKLIAINEISKLESENAVKEILDHIAKMNEESGYIKPLNLFQHYDKIKEQYGNTLQKLAQ
jgi:orotidine-5'-phosphate decarboxylase